MSWLGHPEHPRPLGGSRCPLMKGQVTWFEPKATQTAQALPTDFQLSGTSERTGLSGEAKGYLRRVVGMKAVPTSGKSLPWDQAGLSPHSETLP